MLPALQQLLVLQDRDRRLTRIQAELTAVPGQRLYLKNKASKTTTDFDTAKRQSQLVESDRKRLELEVDTLKERINKVRAQQNDTRSNEQYRAYQHQIATSQTEISNLEDQQLELMEKADGCARELALATKQLAETKAETSRYLADLDARGAKLEAELEVAETARDLAAEPLDDAVLHRYENLLKTKGDPAIVGVHGGVCGGCHMQLTTQAMVSTRGQAEITPCPTCSRILYWTSEMV